MLNYDNKYKLYCIIHAEGKIFHGINSIKIVHISILMQIDVNRSDLNHCNGSHCTIEPKML